MEDTLVIFSGSEPTQVVLDGQAVRITRTGLVLPDGATWDLYREVTQMVIRMKEMAKFCLYDAIKYGRLNYGDEKVKTLLREERVSPQEVDEVLRLEDLVVERRPELTAEHHFVVCKLDKVDQKRWLETAQEHRLSPRDLRASIRANEVVRCELQQVHSKSHRLTGTESYLTSINAIERWIGTVDLEDWPEDRRRNTLEAFGRVLDFLEKLKREMEVGA